MAGIDWRFEGVEIVTCNCDFSCPCQFNALPTHGDCRATFVIRIDKGHFGDTSLDGVKFVSIFAWPRAIHQGNGEGVLIIDESTSEDQRKAVHAIFHGEEAEPGATIFNVFSNVVDTYHEPIVAPVEMNFDLEGRTGSFRVPGIVESRSEPIRNPITGNPHRVRVTLPHGFEYHDAEYASGSAKTDGGPIPLSYDASHAHLAKLNWTPSGPVHA